MSAWEKICCLLCVKFRFSQHCQWKLQSSAIIQCVNWYTGTEISEEKRPPYIWVTETGPQHMSDYLRLVHNTGHYIATYSLSWPKTMESSCTLKCFHLHWKDSRAMAWSAGFIFSWYVVCAVRNICSNCSEMCKSTLQITAADSS